MNIRWLAVTMAAALGLPASAALGLENIDFNGFLTVGATRSDADVDSENGNVTDSVGFDQDTRIGLQVSAAINDRMSVTAQLLGTNREQNNYDALFDWGYVNYSVSQNVNLRGGKIKFPTFLVSDYIEVGYAYPWIRPPVEVYGSNPITAITGIDMLYRARLGPVDLLLQPYYGSANDQQALVPQEVLPMLGKAPGSVDYEDFDASDMAGVNLAFSGDLGTLRAGYLHTTVSADAFGVKDEDVTFWSVGGTFEWHNLIGYSEYFQREIDGQANLFFPDQTGWYATLGYRIDRFLPHVTYAQLRGDNADGADPTQGVGLEQNSVTVGLRYELGTGADIKVEYERVEPEGDSRGLFMQPTDDVGIFSLAVDVIF